MPTLDRKLSVFDATMLVMGGIVGSGIFLNPYVVAREVHTRSLILGAWILGGAVALTGAFLYAALARRSPETGGQYIFLRDAYGPLPAFLYGWTLLLVVQSGGMAAVAVTFARYSLELAPVHMPDWVPAFIALSVLTLINCLGVRSGGAVQSALMLLKVLSLMTLIGAGLFLIHPHLDAGEVAPSSHGLLTSFGAALIPVLFSYGGYQTSCFVAGEMKDPGRDLPKALLFGVLGVVVLYVGINFICVRALGPAQLAVTRAPASAVMRLAWGDTGARWIAVAIALSALGFLSQSILTAPRVYFAMAQDGLFFRPVAWVSPRTHVPLIAITLQSAWTMVILLTGSYEQILNYVESVDALFFALTASTLLVHWRRGLNAWLRLGAVLYIAVNVFIVINAVYRYPKHTLIGMGILASGVPIFYLWNKSRSRQLN